MKSTIDNTQPDYEVVECMPSELNRIEFEKCMAIIGSGEAVDSESARKEIPRATALAIAHRNREIVAVAAIKRIRPNYAKTLALRAGISFDPNLPELGYVAVSETDKGKGLSHRLVAALLAKHNGPVFATTSSAVMGRTLERAGFVSSGSPWRGRRGDLLSLWLKG